jgi:hypothetical protein
VAAVIRVQWAAEKQLGASLPTSDGIRCRVHKPRVVSLAGVSQGSQWCICGHGRARQLRRRCCGRHCRLESLAMACPVPLVFVDALSTQAHGYHDAHDAVLLQNSGSVMRAPTSEGKQFESSTGQPSSESISAPSLSEPQKGGTSLPALHGKSPVVAVRPPTSSAVFGSDRRRRAER